ncbi:hypothetical protein CDD82_4708 [Ophiocordyceps australis]|uniref:GCS light chain n=1 Tax=Ophiocordyceps australis TaxID=1399860 RepID=A0A2C5Z523_9HYPO|nr:hypothetical protein CDD82_4708 [Ophiocordyceps australis]
MIKLILSTGNVMSGGPSIIRKTGSTTRSNLELVNSLRDSFAAAQRDYAPTSKNPHDATPSCDRLAESWTEHDGQTLHVPRIGWEAAGLRDERSQYEITVKLFLLPDTAVAAREQFVHQALHLVSKELGIQTIDLLVVSFPGMSFEGNCEWEADKINAHQGNLEEEVASWRIFEELHRQGIIKRLGVAEFGSEKLGAFISRTTIPPSVDQINLRDCCNVPPPLKTLAHKHGVELNVHVDCTDILPRGTLRELLGQGPQGAGLLADSAHKNAGLHGEIFPQWVVRYMAFIRDRGVIENKGYFAGAELVET